MAQLNVKIPTDQLDALRKYAERRRTPVSWLIKDYVGYLLAGGQPIAAPSDEPTAMELAKWAQYGGAFDWLADEPDLYTDEDGEPI